VATAPLDLQTAPSAAGTVVRRLRIALGTTVAVAAQAPSPRQAAAAVDAAFAAVARVDERLHPGQVNSDLQRLAASVGEAVTLWRGTFEVLRFAQQLSHASGGIFDPCLPQRAGRLGDIELLEGSCCRAIAHAPVALDCGGLAKGFAVDEAITALQSAGCSAGLVNAGGDLRVFGAPTVVLLRRADGLEPLELSQAALAVSDRDARHVPPGHRGYYVRGGAVAQGERYAAVRAAEAMCADALTKCVLLCPAEASAALLRHFGAVRLA
jgi:FAD:protein FMN transferase